jgi:hypothetical protein
MSNDTRNLLSAALFLGAVLLVTFWKSLNPELALFSTDDVLGALQGRKESLPAAWFANWSPLNLVGLASGQESLSYTSLMIWWLPLIGFINWIHFLDAFGAGVFFFLFLRQMKCSARAALLGAMVFCYGGFNFALVYSGHLGKFGCYLWIAATLWALEHALNDPKTWSWRIAAGAFLGLVVCEQPDVAILYVWMFVAYLAFRVFSGSEPSREEPLPDRLIRFVILLAISGAVSGLLAFQVVSNMYRSQVKGVAQLAEESRQQGWDWATQWSYPPEETLELVAPGFFGWRVNEPKGPYWGRTGRSAEYETSGQGFSRFKLDNSFVGVVPMFLAIAMAVCAFHKRARERLSPDARRRLVFWGIVAAVTLLLAFGKHFLAYYFFYAIPKMNIIRNPNKFLHVFAVAIAVLSAHGLQYLIEQREKFLPSRIPWLALAGITVVALLGAIFVSASTTSIQAKFQQEFGQMSAAIVERMTGALVRLAISSGVFAALWFGLSRAELFPKKFKETVPFLIVLLATLDLYLTNRQYVEYYPYKPMYAETELIRFLKKDEELHRVKILPRDPRSQWFGLYNNWLTFLFPYYRIETTDIPQMPRMPTDYEQYFKAVEGNAMRFWELANARYLLGPIEFWPALQDNPLLRPHLSLTHAYNLASSNGVLVTAAAAPNQYNQNTQIIVRFDRALPRVKLYDRWQVIADDRECLRRIAAPEFDPQTEVIVSEAIPASPTGSAAPDSARIEWLHRSANAARLRVTTDRQGVLLFNEKHDPHFRLTVDGHPARLLRCNYIMKGAFIEPGTHEVYFEYRPPRLGFSVSLTAWVACLVGAPALRLWEQGRPQKKK